MSTENTTKLTEAIGVAERAVAGMEESGRKDKAFEMILARLLDVGAPEGPRKNVKKRKASNPATAAKPGNSKSKKSPRALIEDLVKDGYFDGKRSIGDLVKWLREGGHTFSQPQLSKPLQQLTQAKKLRRQKEGEKGPFMYERYAK
jgi:hypothetical protein